ncbi:mrkC, partial [Symbiodinium sp. KB8]
MDGLAHVHDMRVVHRDIKLENLLLDTYGCVKIADFGVAVVAQPGKQLHEHCGTPSYIAPEILLEAGYEGFPADVWSSGVSLYAMLCGRLPFKGKSMAELKRSILRGQYHLPDHLSPSSVSLVNTMLTLEPRSRPRVGAVLAHDFLQGVHTRANQLY